MGSQIESGREVDLISSSSDPKPEGKDMDARVQSMWEQMNKGPTNNKNIKPTSNKCSSSSPQKLNDNWMTYLGIAPKNTRKQGKDYQNKGNVVDKTLTNSPSSKPDNWMGYLGLRTKNTEESTKKKDALQKESSNVQSTTSDEAIKIAAAALSAVKDAAAAASATSALGRGKIEIKEVRDFAGQDIEVKKLVDAESQEASERGRSCAVDEVLEQIKKKPKLSVLDKTKKDWGEFKDENKGLENELDAYKKSSNQYLDRVSFLQRADYREFERERDARLAQQARRRTDMREDGL